MPMVRIANLRIHEADLEDFTAALREEVETSLEIEDGVLTLYAVSAKFDPTRITLLEIYENQAAYESHLNSPHFIKYKTITQDMVKSLELVESTPLIAEMKIW